MSVPSELLNEEGRADLTSFYNEVFGFGEMPTMTIDDRYILKLAPFDPVDMPLSAADRGSAIHESLGEFTREYATALPDNVVGVLRRIGEKHFAPRCNRRRLHCSSPL